MARARVIALRYAGTCSICQASLAAGTKASWDSTAHMITCTSCLEAAAAEPAAEPAPQPAVTIASGTAGSSAQRLFDRKHEQREHALEERWGRFAGIAKFLSDDPQKTRAWSKGADGERLLARSLNKWAGERAVVLHDRRIPGSQANIDHIAIASSGVWVIDAKNYKGKVEHRDVGGWFRTDMRLYVNGRDRTKLVTGMQRQIVAVTTAVGDDHPPLMPVLCFVWSDWNLFANPFHHEGVLVTWPKDLGKRICKPGQLEPETVRRIAEKLATSLPFA